MFLAKWGKSLDVPDIAASQKSSIDSTKFNQMVKDSPNGCIKRVCIWCKPGYTTLYYCRLKEYPADLLKVLQDHWSQDNNILGNHFNIYSNYKDAVLRKNEWIHCDCLAKGIGFPSNCGWYYRN